MGAATETYTKIKNISRSEQAAFAAMSHGRAAEGVRGARIALHLALELKRRGDGTKVAALCGGGQGDALVIRVPEGRWTLPWLT
jgi:acetyl-CoA acetyltransferase